MKRYKCSDLSDKPIFVPQPRPVFPSDYIPYSYFPQPYTSGQSDPGTFADQQILYEPYWSITASPQSPTPAPVVPSAYRGVDIPVSAAVETPVNAPIKAPVNITNTPPVQVASSSVSAPSDSFPFTSSKSTVSPVTPVAALNDAVSNDTPLSPQPNVLPLVGVTEPPPTIADDTPYYQEPSGNTSPLMAYRENIVSTSPITPDNSMTNDTPPSSQTESSDSKNADPPITIAENTPYYPEEPYGMTSPLMSYREDTNSLPPSATFHLTGAVLNDGTLPLAMIQVSDSDITFEKPGTIHLKAGYAYQVTYFIQSVMEPDKEIEICIPVIGAKGPGCKTSGNASFLLEAEEPVQFHLRAPQELNMVLSGRVTVLKKNLE